jgi:hypothetical protein
MVRTDDAMLRRPVLPLLVLIAALAAAGCGTSGDRDQARAAADRLYAAVRAGDGSAACAQMSPALRAALVDDAGKRCARAVLDLDLAGRAPRDVEVYANSARVRFAGGGDAVFLGDTRLGWRVEALGCRPPSAAGDADGPYDCEAEA